ncbi:hypothetical protein BN2127_JRS8_01825 [Bacillus amyloliquefaciens]|nr:hypothetical protein BN2127_JRS8_01825 [Bacillus amyloliquefaciens]
MFSQLDQSRSDERKLIQTERPDKALNNLFSIFFRGFIIFHVDISFRPYTLNRFSILYVKCRSEGFMAFCQLFHNGFQLFCIKLSF